MNDVFSIILFDLQYMRIDFEMFFIKMFDQKLFVLTFFFYFARRTIKISVSLCQCECNLSKITNFCLTIAHEIYDNERINSTKMSMILSSCLFYFRFLICFCSVIHWLDSRIRALSILFYFSTITCARSRTKRNHFEKLVFRCQKSINFFTFFDLKFIRTRNICFSFFDLIFALLFESHRNDLKNHYDRDFRI